MEVSRRVLGPGHWLRSVAQSLIPSILYYIITQITRGYDYYSSPRTANPFWTLGVGITELTTKAPGANKWIEIDGPNLELERGRLPCCHLLCFMCAEFADMRDPRLAILCV